MSVHLESRDDVERLSERADRVQISPLGAGKLAVKFLAAEGHQHVDKQIPSGQAAA